ELIDVKYELREPFLDIRKAFDPGQPQMTDKGNVFFYDPYDHRRVTKGDVDAAFEKADVIVKGSYRPSAIEQAPIEPQGCLVIPESDGRLTVHTCTQAMYFTMGVLAEHLQRAPGSIKLVGGTVGGGFGGKVDSASEPLASLLALKARRPVRWVFTREEEMLCGSVRASWHVEMADAVSKDGWILGRKVLTLHDAGAYTRFSSYGATKHSFHLAGAYTVPALRTRAYVIWTNHVPTTAMRGFGVTSASFAIELQMTRTATLLGIDPWEFRLKNANRPGDLMPTRKVLEDPSTIDTIQACAAAVGHPLSATYRDMKNEPRSGEWLPDHLRDQEANAKLGNPQEAAR
ncbi:MAG: hypothetical protein QOC86_2438, partial [Gaiellales bacterium]|nr:hypothetical protein [Gaiellales bacterium]